MGIEMGDKAEKDWSAAFRALAEVDTEPLIADGEVAAELAAAERRGYERGVRRAVELMEQDASVPVASIDRVRAVEQGKPAPPPQIKDCLADRLTRERDEALAERDALQAAWDSRDDTKARLDGCRRRTEAEAEVKRLRAGLRAVLDYAGWDNPDYRDKIAGLLPEEEATDERADG